MDVITTNPLKAKTKTPIDMSWEHISPARAAEWLENTTRTAYAQRGLDKNAVDRYLSQHSRGLWHSNTGDTICITNHKNREVVLDGQHRLSMIAKAQKGVDMWVARNVPANAFKYKDGGKKRVLKDVMVAAGWGTDSSILAIAGNFLWLHETEGCLYSTQSNRYSVMEGDKFDWLCEYRPDIKAEYSENKKVLRRTSKEMQMPVATLFFFWVVFGNVDKTLRNDVFSYLTSPLEKPAPSNNFTYMVMKLRDLQAEFRRDTGSTRTEVQRKHYAIAVMLAWNAHRAGKIYRTATGFNKDFNKLANGCTDVSSLPFSSISDLWCVL
jgi:hypothetical protein